MNPKVPIGAMGRDSPETCPTDHAGKQVSQPCTKLGEDESMDGAFGNKTQKGDWQIRASLVGTQPSGAPGISLQEMNWEPGRAKLKTFLVPTGLEHAVGLFRRPLSSSLLTCPQVSLSR